MTAKEHEGAKLATLATLLILMALDLLVLGHLEALAAPNLAFVSWPQALDGPVSLAIAAPAVGRLARATEGEMVVGLAAETEFSALVLLGVGAGGSRRGGSGSLRFIMEGGHLVAARQGDLVNKGVSAI
jgi:hypothetical protein